MMFLNENDILHKYTKEMMTVQQIASIYKVTSGTIKDRLISNNITIRTNKNYFIDLTGKTFGLLTVTGLYSTEIDKRGMSVRKWSCDCECGNTTIVRGGNLRSGTTTTCGNAIHKSGNLSKKWGGYGEISAQFWSTQKTHAKNRGKTFDITIEFAWNLFLKQNRKCVLTGLDLTMSIGMGKTRVHYGNASLDRINSKLPYTQDNVQWIDKRINKMKQDLPEDEFIELCHILSSFQRNKTNA